MTCEVATGFVAVTPSDTQDIQKALDGKPPRAFRFGTGGTAVIVGLDGTIGNFINIANGETIPASGKRINATGTTAQNIVGLY